MRRALIIILARGGSKGVPGKNTAIVGGRPCIAWTIDAALASGSAALVAVSSDDRAARAIAEQSGCAVIHRPEHLASDAATIDDAARHAVLELEDRGMAPQPQSPDAAIIILYANVPVRPAGLIDAATALLSGSGCDSVQSYQPVGKNHPWWTARLDEGGVVRPWEGDVLNHGVFRRQDLPPAYIPDGAVIAVTRRALFREVPGVKSGPHAFFGADRRGIVNPHGSVVDIDAPIDLIVADAILSGSISIPGAPPPEITPTPKPRAPIA